MISLLMFLLQSDFFIMKAGEMLRSKDINHFKSNYTQSCEAAVKFLETATSFVDSSYSQRNEIKELPPSKSKLFFDYGKGNDNDEV
jgi:hypothetical protein